MNATKDPVFSKRKRTLEIASSNASSLESTLAVTNLPQSVDRVQTVEALVASYTMRLCPADLIIGQGCLKRVSVLGSIFIDKCASITQLMEQVKQQLGWKHNDRPIYRWHHKHACFIPIHRAQFDLLFCDQFTVDNHLILVVNATD